MLKYDSVHGKFPGTVEAYDGGLIVNGKKYPVFTSMEVKDIPWASVGAEYICECTGKHLTKELLPGPHRRRRQARHHGRSLQG